MMMSKQVGKTEVYSKGDLNLKATAKAPISLRFIFLKKKLIEIFKFICGAPQCFAFLLYLPFCPPPTKIGYLSGEQTSICAAVTAAVERLRAASSSS